MNYLLIGPESYRLRKRKEEIIKNAVGVNDDFAVSYYKGIDKVDVRNIIDDCNTIPFLADNKVVVFENPLFFSEMKERKNDEEDNDDSGNKEVDYICDYLKNPCSSTIFIITYEGTVPSNSKIVKALCNGMKYEHFDFLSKEEFETLVRKDLTSSQLTLDEKALNELLVRLPISIENWKREWEKLKLYPGKIDRNVIIDLVCKPLEDNAFELSNAIVDKSTGKAIEIFRDLMVTHKNDIPVFVGLIASQFRTMTQVKILNEQHCSFEQIAQHIGTKSEYRVRMVNKAIGNTSLSELMGILDELSTLDQNIKEGKIDGPTGFELFIIKATRR